MTYHYSPFTGEHIATRTPATWMAHTNLEPPVFDAATQSCLYQNGAWVVSDVLPPTPLVPEVVTMRQARLALLDAGLLDAVNAGIGAMPQAVQIEWEFAATVDRASHLVAALAGALELDDAALDTLFTQGASL